MEVLIVQGDGRTTRVDPGPVRTLRGTVAEQPGSIVVGYAGLKGLEAVVRFSEGDTYDLVALEQHSPGAPRDAYAWFQSTNRINQEPDGTCWMTDVIQTNPHAAGRPVQGAGTCDPVGPFVAEIGCDTDALFVHSFPGDTDKQLSRAQAHIETNVNDLNAFVYELPPLATTHDIIRIVLRLEPGESSSASGKGPVVVEDDIYAAIDDPGDLLTAISLEWETNQADAGADLTTLYTGHTSVGSAIGAGRLGSVCNPGVCWVSMRGRLRQLDLTAHEVGHVWGAPHCPDSPCNGCSGSCPIMKQGVWCNAYEDIVFMPCSIDAILSSRSDETCILDLGFLQPAVSADGSPLDSGDALTFPGVLTSEPSSRALRIVNDMLCTVPIRIELTNTAGGRFSLPGPPMELAPGGVEDFTVFFRSDFAGDYTGELRITTPGLFSGYHFSLELNATAGVGGNLPSVPDLFCPPDNGITVQPAGVEFAWSLSSFVESYDFIISITPLCSAPVFFQTGLQQASFTPPDLELAEGQTYCWKVIANNVNGSASSHLNEFVVDSNAAVADAQTLYEHLPVANDATLNLPLDPINKKFKLRVRNRGGAPLELRSFSLPNDFTLTIVEGGAGLEGAVTIPPCHEVTLDFKSTLSLPDLMHTTPIFDMLSFETTDPNAPRVVVNLCFRCEPLSCQGAPFAGCGTVDGVTGSCYHFTGDCGTEFAIHNVGGFQIGDHAFVSGIVDPDGEFCFPQLHRAHIPNNTISACGSELGRCCYFGISSTPLCGVTTQSDCDALEDSTWTQGEDCTGSPCGQGPSDK
jgi:hypothetical protein